MGFILFGGGYILAWGGGSSPLKPMVGYVPARNIG